MPIFPATLRLLELSIGKPANGVKPRFELRQEIAGGAGESQAVENETSETA